MSQENEDRLSGAHPVTGAPMGRPGQVPARHNASATAHPTTGAPLGKPGQVPSQNRAVGRLGGPLGKPGQVRAPDPNRSQTGRRPNTIHYGQAYVWPTERQPMKHIGQPYVWPKPVRHAPK